MCDEWYPTPHEPQSPTNKDRNWYDRAAERDTSTRNFIKWYATNAIPAWFPYQETDSHEKKQRALMMHDTAALLHEMATSGLHTTEQLDGYLARCGSALQDSSVWNGLFAELVVLYSPEPVGVESGVGTLLHLPQEAQSSTTELALAS